jgi:methylated-DNA-[protein]-cysteine S-methyltransferase
MRHRLERCRHCRRAACRGARDRNAQAALQIFSRCARNSSPPNIERAIQGIGALLRGEYADFSDIILDMTDIPAFFQRVYRITREIPRGATLTYNEIAVRVGASGALNSVSQAIARNPFVIIVPCHRVLEKGGYADTMSPHGGIISKRRLLSIEGTPSPSTKTLFDVLLPPVAPPRLSG